MRRKRYQWQRQTLCRRGWCGAGRRRTRRRTGGCGRRRLRRKKIGGRDGRRSVHGVGSIEVEKDGLSMRVGVNDDTTLRRQDRSARHAARVAMNPKT
eukprot:4111036-Pleurochrysis_carterae.AAC.1